MKLKLKLLFSFSIILILNIIISFLAYNELTSIDKQYSELLLTELPNLRQIADIRYNVSQQSSNIRGYFLYNDEKYIVLYNNNNKLNQDMLAKFINSEKDADDKTLMSQILVDLNKYDTVIKSEAIPLYKSKKNDETKKILREKALVYLNNINSNLEIFYKDTVKLIKSETLRLNNESKKSKKFILFLSIISVIIGFIISLILATLIVKPVKKLVNVANEVSQGNLNETIDKYTKDEIGQLSKCINEMILSLKDIISNIGKNSQVVASSSEELSANVEQSAQTCEHISLIVEKIATGSKVQNNQVNLISNSVSNVASEIEQINSNTQLAVDISQSSLQQANIGKECIDKVIEQFNLITDNVTESGNIVKILGEKSIEVGEIVDIIKTIADQTHLLSLNATIESARAGEYGKGFAVVAEEVRKLAEKSAQSSKEIAQIIKSIQAESINAINSMDKSYQELIIGKEIVNETDSSFSQILLYVEKVVNEIKKVSESINELTKDSNNIATSLKEIKKVVEENSSDAESVSASIEEQTASLEEIASSSSSLSMLATELQTLINKFHV